VYHIGAMKNYQVVIRNFHNHEARNINVSEKNVQLAHKLALKQVRFEEDIVEMFNDDNHQVYHLQKGWRE